MAAVNPVVFDLLTKKQRYVLGMCAMGFDGDHSRRSLSALVKKGLLAECEESVTNGVETLTLTRYQMPMAVHIAWCRWCADCGPEAFGRE